MSLNETELARRDASAVECRTEPLRVRWVFPQVAAADAHTVDCRFSCSVRIADNPADRRMFVEVFLTAQNTVTAQTISEHFTTTLKSALSARLSQCKAADVIAGEQRENLQKILADAATPLAFSSGLELLPPFQLDFDSPTLHRQKLEDNAHTRQLQHFQQAGELLKQFRALQESAPHVPAGKLLDQINPADRGLTLQALLLAESKESSPPNLWAVAGQYLLKIDPRAVPPAMELIELPSTLGALRSVQQADRQLLIGARSGVMLVDPQNPSSANLFEISNLDSQLGFNRVIHTTDHLWATHGDAGIVRWSLNDPKNPQQQAIKGPRNLQVIDDSTLICSAGNELLIVDEQSHHPLPTHSTSEIIAILPTERTLIAVHEDGTLLVIDRLTQQIVEARRRPGNFSAAELLPWLGDVRILLAGNDGPIDCIGLHDPLVTEYLSPYRGLKILSAAGDIIAAVSPDRQKIILWQTWDGQRPLGEIHVAGRTRHRIADVQFV